MVLDPENGEDSAVPGAFHHVPILNQKGAAVIPDAQVCGFLDVLFFQLLRQERRIEEKDVVEQLGKVFAAFLEQLGRGGILLHALTGDSAIA